MLTAPRHAVAPEDSNAAARSAGLAADVGHSGDDRHPPGHRPAARRGFCTRSLPMAASKAIAGSRKATPDIARPSLAHERPLPAANRRARRCRAARGRQLDRRSRPERRESAARQPVAIGDEVVLEINDLPHTGCGKFQWRYGAEARAFVNNARGMQLHLRGRYGSVVSARHDRGGRSQCANSCVRNANARG